MPASRRTRLGLLTAACAVFFVTSSPGLRAVAAPETPRFSATPPPADMDAWRLDFREALRDALGLDAMPPAGPGRVRTEDQTDIGLYRREHIALEVEPDVWSPAYVFVPTHGRPVATVIALHGHGPGKSLTVGLASTAAGRIAIRDHERDFGRQAALRGYAVIVPDQRGFGEWMTDEDRTAGRLWACERLQPEALSRGRTLIGERVYDVQQWITYAEQRPEMDASRLAVIGHSAGGTTALFAAALDERIDVAVVSGYFGTWARSITGIEHCVCNEVPGIERLGDLADIACLVAPRPLLLSLGAKDEWMPPEPARAAFPTVQACYEQAGGGPVLLRFGDGGHRVYGAQVWPFLAEHLPVER